MRLLCQFYIVLVVLSTLYQPTSAYAEEFVLNIDGKSVSTDIIPYSAYLTDDANAIPDQDIISGKLDAKFTENRSKGLKFNSHYLWLKLRVKNTTAHSLDYVIEGSQLVMPEETFYIIDSRNHVMMHKTGALADDSQREILHNRSVVPINLEPNEEKLVYLKTVSPKTYHAVQYSITEKNLFISTSHKVEATSNLIIGAIFILAAYNLFLFLSVRDRIYLYYSAYVIFSLFATIFEENSGTLSPFIPRFYHEWHYEIYFVVVNLFIISLHLFARNFLHLPRWCYKVSQVLIWLNIVWIISGLIFIANTDMIRTVIWLYFGTYLSIEISSALILYSAIVNLRQGYRPALYYLIAFTFFACGITAYLFYMENIIPSNIIWAWSGKVGLLIEATLMSFALADRIRQMREEEEQLIKELTESNAELERFAYICSHDLQEPLRMISNYTERLVKHLDGKLDEKGQHYVHYVVDGAANARALISDILTYAKVGMEPDKAESVDCEEVFLMIMNYLKAPIQDGGAHLTHDPLPSVQAHRTQVAQLFQNLISNAIKFQHRNRPPVIHIGVEPRGQYWQFSVADNGIGISGSHQEKIFQIFQRLNKRTEYPGTGIGLAICKKIVETYGGKIWVESEMGTGTTFFFTLPAAKEGIIHT